MAGQKLNPEEQIMLQKLGERITALRKAKGYNSYETFAHENNLNRSQYWRYEQGENMKILNLVRIAEVLGVSLEELIKDCF